MNLLGLTGRTGPGQVGPEKPLAFRYFFFSDEIAYNWKNNVKFFSLTGLFFFFCLFVCYTLFGQVGPKKPWAIFFFSKIARNRKNNVEFFFLTDSFELVLNFS